jgi:UvrB/uvrC motif
LAVAAAPTLMTKQQIACQVLTALDKHRDAVGDAGGMSSGLSAEGSERLSSGLQLQAQLQEAINGEDYLLAAELRDKVRKLKVRLLRSKVVS